MGETNDGKVEIVDVTTQTAKAYKFEGRVMDLGELIVELANDIKIIKKSIV